MTERFLLPAALAEVQKNAANPIKVMMEPARNKRICCSSYIRVLSIRILMLLCNRLNTHRTIPTILPLLLKQAGEEANGTARFPVSLARSGSFNILASP